ncbi:nadh-quinone oxidoreductase subunit f [Holotrichia oblita]|nr:nadh-quinone oxidoreductase subunit f [Holotrichia oblita]
MKGKMNVRTHSGDCTKVANGERAHILICGGTGCTSGSSLKIQEELKSQLKANKLEKEVQVVLTGCFGLCAKGPIVVIYPEGSFYEKVKVADVREIVEEHILKGHVVDRLLHRDAGSNQVHTSINTSKFYKSQRRIVLKNCGLIDPENIDEYLAQDGYLAYEKCVKEMTPDQVIELVTASGLRGRGGGGYPAGKKWLATKIVKSDQKFVVCNADEGDPGAFMDRSVLEGDPHCVIEAMMIAGYCVGATMGYVYIRAEYPIAVNRLQIAINQAREYGILGKNAMGLGHAFDIELRLGAGAFVCGEATALIASVEGHRGEPKQKPPHLAEDGLWNKPTVLNNVETFANIPPIILKGVNWFKSMGSEKSPGTKVFALGGKIENTGLVEIPMGTTLRTIIEDIGGGCPNGKKFKAAQTGGPSGGCIPASLIDTPIDYDNLTAVGSMMGSGGLIVMDEDNCMVDIAKFFLEFTVDESCGKCTPCRIGNKRMYEILEKITNGQGTMDDLNTLEELSRYIKNNSLCGLGQCAPNPVMSTLKYFRDEYVAHVKDKKCPAGVCKAMLNYFVIPEKCIGCGLCKRACPANAGICNDGSCRVCVVEVKGSKNLVTSCFATVKEGMEVFTNTPSVIKSRKMTIELLMSSHNQNCLSCVRSGDCELQRLSYYYDCDSSKYAGAKEKYELENSNAYLVRDNNKCVLCRRCVAMCNKVQGIGVIGANARGFKTNISCAFEKDLNDTPCVACGQCITVCPVGALHERDNTKEVMDALRDPAKHVVVGVAPAVRVALGEEFGMPIGTDVEGKLVTSLKMMGFNKVFDVNMTADLTIMEEGTELLHRLSDKNAVLPMMTSCSPGWVRYVEFYYPELLPHLSSCKSPQQMFGAVIKTYYAKKFNLDPKDIVVVTVMPCVAKKTEVLRNDQSASGYVDVDITITTREYARMLKKNAINFAQLPDGQWDNPIGEGSTAGLIFGATGGVMEAALRTVYEIVTGKTLQKLDFTEVRGVEGIKEAEIDMDGKKIKVCVAHSLSNAKKIMEEIKAGKSPYHFVEVMTCPGGCVNGGGQPIVMSDVINSGTDVRALRAKTIYEKDKKSPLRKSHENEIIKTLYKEYFEKPGSHRAHEVLHTTYKKRDKYSDK